jgi:hypothetical protein
MKLLALAWTLWQMNRGQTFGAKQIIDEAMQFIHALGAAMKDGRISAAEKTVLIRELREFSRAATEALDDLRIPK